MGDTIFTKIINGEIPSHKVYEDERVFAFLDIGPLSEGHTLVVPREPVATIDMLSDESAAAIGRVLPRICRAVCEATGASDFNILQNNGAAAHQEVPHVHFHIIPRFPDRPEDGGLGVVWKPGAFDHGAGAALAGRIAALIGG
ncbi:MAG: HIT family protein [Phycisphaeraceae bacterium]|nr:HIT family protein [Phycisphaeraceae bacterium]MCB9847339.1 HIT family protein [Phycisphaeraceae bacterium]